MTESQEERTTRLIRATYTDTTVRVYQAYNDQIAESAVEAQSFQAALQQGLWSPKRMTWIKPSKVWMAYRCGWTKLKDSNQARVLALDLDRTKFQELLGQATLTMEHQQQQRSHGSSESSKSSPSPKQQQDKKCRNSSVVVQWDPERVMDTKAVASNQVFTKSTPHVRSIQIGLRPPANECLLDPQVVRHIMDVTQDFRQALEALQEGRLDDAAVLLWPDNQQEEALLEIPQHIQARLNMTVPPPCKKDAVVVLGCTANPPHQGHLHCLREARSEAARLGFNVLFTTIAVAPFGYVKSKMRSVQNPWLLDDSVRLKVLALTASDMEGTAKFGFRAPTRTFGSALECGRALRPNDETFVIVVGGGDRFNWKKKVHADMVTLCCARSEEQVSTLRAELDADIGEGFVSDPSKWLLMSSVGPPTSSTMVRSILTNDNKTTKEKLQDLLVNGYPDDAARLLLDSTTESH